MRILIVEDDPLCAEALRYYMEPYSSSIHYASTIADCFKYTEHLQFDLIILDLRLTDSTADNTIDCIGELRAMQSHAAIVVMSGMHPAEYFRKRALESGADHFISKNSDFSRNALYLAVIAALKHHANDGTAEEISKRIASHVCVLEKIAVAK